MPAVVNCPADRVLLEYTAPPGDCHNCGSDDLTWSLAAVLVSGAPQSGLLRLNEVRPCLVLGCESCSQTLWTLDNDEEVEQHLGIRMRR